MERARSQNSGAPVSMPAVLVIATVALAMDPWGFDVFAAPKMLALALTVPAGLALAVWRQRGLWWPGKWWMVAVLVSAAVATGLSDDVVLSLVGEPERNLGLWTVVLLIGAASLGAAGRLDRLLDATTVVAAVVAGYGLAQVLGLDPMDWQAGLDLSRARSTFGSATTLGGFLAFATPLVTARAVVSTGGSRNWTSASAAMCAVGLLASGTRSAWLGLAVAVIVGAVRWRERLRGRGARRLAIAGAGLVAVAIGLTLTPLAPDLASTLSRSTAAGRVALWEPSVEVIADAPVVGHGFGGLRRELPAHLDEDFAVAYGRDQPNDRAHNVLLDLLAVGGIPLAVAAIGLAVVTLLAAWRSATEPMMLGLLVAFVAYAVHLQFAFPTMEVDATVAVFAGVVLHAGGRTWRWQLWGAARAAATMVLVLLAGAGAVVGVREVVASRHLRAAAVAEAVEDLDTALRLAASAADLVPERRQYRQASVRMGTRVGERAGDPATVAAAERAAERLVALTQDPEYRLDLARATATLAALTDAPADHRRARRRFEVVLNLDPNDPRAWLGLGAVTARAGDLSAAEDALLRATELAPDRPGPWINLGAVHEMAGDVRAARAAYARALELDPASEAARAGLRRTET